MKMKTWITIVILAFACGVYASENVPAADNFAQGTEAYKTGDYRGALELFLAAETTTEGFAINYNLANCYYKLSKIPESILHYERALKFEPGNEDARYNLRLANEKIADRIENIPVSKIAIWWEEQRFGIGPDIWAVTALCLALLSGLSLFLFILARKPGNKRLGFFIALVALVLAIAVHQLARSSYSHRYAETTAVVFAAKIDVKSEPRAESINVFVLHAGTKVALLQRDGDWYEILIGSGNKGWLKADDVVEI
jgi:tetratricopeptide (TPR) repeat protein